MPAWWHRPTPETFGGQIGRPQGDPAIHVVVCAIHGVKSLQGAGRKNRENKATRKKGSPPAGALGSQLSEAKSAEGYARPGYVFLAFLDSTAAPFVVSESSRPGLECLFTPRLPPLPPLIGRRADRLVVGPNLHALCSLAFSRFARRCLAVDCLGVSLANPRDRRPLRSIGGYAALLLSFLWLHSTQANMPAVSIPVTGSF